MILLKIECQKNIHFFSTSKFKEKNYNFINLKKVKITYN